MLGSALFVSLAMIVPAPEDGKRLDPPKDIYRIWMHSVEEDTDKEEVYRPAGFNFPPARGREGFEVKEKGVFIAHEIGPGDGEEKIIGKWECNELNVLKVTFPDAKAKELLPGEIIPPPKPRTLCVTSCDKKILRLKKPEPKKAAK